MKVGKFAVRATLEWCLRSAFTPKIHSFYSVAGSDVPVFRSYPILIVVFLVGGGN